MMINDARIFSVSADEFKSHCKVRADHHRRRAEEKESELPKLIESLNSLRKRTPTDEAITVPEGVIRVTDKGVAKADDLRWPDGKTSNYKGDNDQIESIQKEIRNHLIKASQFLFFSKHIRDDTTFLMTVVELQSLEFIPSLQY